MASVTIPDSVTSIGNWAFYECTSLKSITIPKSVSEISEYAFGYYWDDNTYEYKLVDGFKIYCYADTAAETYAKENDIDYELLTDSTPGDADGDGEINMTDVVTLQRYISGWNNDIDTDAVDVNDDGEVNMADVVQIQRYISGWDVELK